MLIVYGGSFNPPTIAHYEISKYLIHKYKPTAFIFAPVGNPYQKTYLIAFNHRYKMLQLIVDQLPQTYITDYENKTAFKGTIDLLQHIEGQYNEMPTFVLGADNILTLDKWLDYQQLVRRYRFIVFNRGEIDLTAYLKSHTLFKDYLDHFLIETDFPKFDVSSSRYRSGKEDDMVLKVIDDYIKQNKLYKRGK